MSDKLRFRSVRWPASRRFTIALTIASLAAAAPAMVDRVCAQPLGYAAESAFLNQQSNLPPREATYAVADSMPDHLKRAVVAYDAREAPGTIVIDTANTFLYYVLGQGRAIRYGVGVGRDGFAWSGVQAVSRKAEWPDWMPPAEMIARQPHLPRWIGGSPGNPLGARAIYLGSSIYRIHGTNDPMTIGKFMSSGCIRMTNEDVIDLFRRVTIGTRVAALPKALKRNLNAYAAMPARRFSVTADVHFHSRNGTVSGIY